VARAVAIGSERGALSDLARSRGLYIRVTGDVVTVEKGGRALFRGTAAETHRWLRDPRRERLRMPDLIGPQSPAPMIEAINSP
jgi:hypothetical protein